MLFICILLPNEPQRPQPFFDKVSGSGSNSTRCAHDDAPRSDFFKFHSSLLSDAIAACQSSRMASGGVEHLMDGESGSFAALITIDITLRLTVSRNYPCPPSPQHRPWSSTLLSQVTPPPVISKGGLWPVIYCISHVRHTWYRIFIFINLFSLISCLQFRVGLR